MPMITETSAESSKDVVERALTTAEEAMEMVRRFSDLTEEAFRMVNQAFYKGMRAGSEIALDVFEATALAEAREVFGKESAYVKFLETSLEALRGSIMRAVNRVEKERESSEEGGHGH